MSKKEANINCEKLGDPVLFQTPMHYDVIGKKSVTFRCKDSIDWEKRLNNLKYCSEHISDQVQKLSRKAV